MKFFILLLFHVSSLYLTESQHILHSKQGKSRQHQYLNNGWKEVQPINQQQLNNNFWNRPQQPVTPNYFMKPVENNVYQWPLYQQSATPAAPQKIPVYQNNVQNPFDPQNLNNWNKPTQNPQHINNNQFNHHPNQQWQYFTPIPPRQTTSTSTTTTTSSTTSLDLNKLFNQQKQNQQHLLHSMNNTLLSGGPRIIIDDNCMKCLCFIESWCSDVGCVMDQGSLSCGWFQLKYDYWLDCGSPGGDWKTCANSKSCAEGCVRRYMERYGPGCMPNVAQPECPDLLRIHNGGPQGCKAPHTEYYGWLIARCLRREPPYENIDSHPIPN